MSLSNFGVINSQQGVISRIKPYHTPNIQGVVPVGGIPVVRAGNKNYYTLTLTNEISDAGWRTVVNLYTTNPTVLVTATDFTSIAAGAKVYAMWLSSTDQCLYVVYKGTDGLIRLSQINDSTGAVTHIGSGFTPATPSNWANSALMEEIGGSLRVSYNGYFHTLNKTTGAVITQDSPFLLSGYASLGATYTSLDNATYATNTLYLMPLGAATSSDGVVWLPTVANASVGIVSNTYAREEDVFGTTVYGHGVSGGVLRLFQCALVDSDKMCLYTDLNSVGCPLNIVLRSSYDSFLASIVNYRSGL